jgi:AAA15 family ATPase/GTPase
MLKSFHIQNYRNLKSVSVNQLAQVNLLVGLNNVGKTSFLEAVNLYCSKNPIGVIDKILQRRGIKIKEIVKEESLNTVFDLLTSFFYKKIPNSYNNQGITLNDSPKDTLNIKLENPKSATKNQEFEDITNFGLSFLKHEINTFFTLQESFYYNFLSNKNIEYPSVFVSSNSMNYSDLGRFWDNNIYLTDKETDVINALKIIEPQIEKIGFKGDITRSVEIKLKGDNQLHSINDMGDGMNRILSIIISLINAENGTLLIDEFENGLHYTAQYQLWEMIFTLSLKLNVQVFVSTHSSDCIKAFENTLNNGFSENGRVLRLENRKGNITIQEFDSKEMEIVTQNDVEIR